MNYEKAERLSLELTDNLCNRILKKKKKFFFFGGGGGRPTNSLNNKSVIDILEQYRDTTFTLN